MQWLLCVNYVTMKIILSLKLIGSICLFCLLACAAQDSGSRSSSVSEPIKEVIEPETKAYNFQRASVSKWSQNLKGLSVAAVVNHSSYEVDGKHLVDHLLNEQISIKSIFAPEHGFKGKADAGEQIVDGKYRGIKLFSLYGKNKKPSAEQLKGIDIVIFDMQDVGARFYTYISTMHYVMEACADQNIKMLILDRPNPNGHYVDGPVREKAYESFVGMHAIPIVHGMTIAELAQMINGEKWLANAVQCDLQIVKLENYSRNKLYELPIKPSPNLPNLRSVLLYPSLCLFEGTEISIGRGTDTQFQVWGHPALQNQTYSFTPTPQEGAKYPKHEGKNCNGKSLIDKTQESIFYNEAYFNLDYLLEAYNAYPDKSTFFLKNLFFDKLAGTDKLRKQIIAGISAEEIKSSWQADLSSFKAARRPYLLYD